MNFGQKQILKIKSDLKLEGQQVTVIGGSDLFHGAPFLSLKVASRIVDMVFFSSPEPSIGRIAERIKSQLFSFVWVPWSDVRAYIQKSDAVLIGPGMKRWNREKDKTKAENSKVIDNAGARTRKIVESLLKKFKNKKWIIDGGALQVMDPRWIPENSIVTPNQKEFRMLFGKRTPKQAASDYRCVVLAKGETAVVCSPDTCFEIKIGEKISRGGTGDVLAGLTVGLAAKTDPLLAASFASFIGREAVKELERKVGRVFNADDLADQIPQTLKKYLV